MKTINLFCGPKERLFKIFLPKLKELCEYLEELEKRLTDENSLDEIVPFFDIVSKWHDEGVESLILGFQRVNYGQYDEAMKNLRILHALFIRAGRDRFGWNCTGYGEKVTEDKVYLGRVYGIKNKNIRYWKKCKNDPKKNWGIPEMENLNEHDVISQHAKKFMISCIGMMTIAIKRLENSF